MNYRCPGYTNNKAKHISKKLDWDFWHACRLFQQVNGYLISHAGVAGRFWNSELDTGAAVEALDGHCQVVLERLPFHSFALLKPGQARGGYQEQGGITWLDFDSEFSDLEIPPPQIVGHTPSEKGPRQNGRSWCLDGYQSCYGILHRSAGETRGLPQGWADLQTLDQIKAARPIGKDTLGLDVWLNIFASVALLLSALGLYGVISYSVAQRTREFGIRSALGATAGNILWLTFRKGLFLTAVGLVLGIAGALSAGQILATMLFQVEQFDPLTLGTIIALQALIALLACFVPARRALKVSPLVALRYE